MSGSVWDRITQGGPDDCWLWTGAKTRGGYGMINVKGLDRYVHRAVYRMMRGPIPDGMLVCHKCDNPTCCNPAHLFLGTQADNAHDRDAKGRHVRLRGTRNGYSKLTDKDIHVIRRAAFLGVKQRDIAKRFGVSQGTIGFVLRGETWTHVLEANDDITAAKAYHDWQSDDSAMALR